LSSWSGSCSRELGLTVIMVTHDLNTLAGLATHVAVLADQHIVAFGPADEVMSRRSSLRHRLFWRRRRKLL
jgi:phospholipid/cholesterol/gamma-HCH transport system ATP-binding protein